LARYAEAHARIGVHLAILAVFALALFRFIDKLPPNRGSSVFRVFAVSAVVLCVTTLVVFALVLAVIWGFGTRFPAAMRTWLDHTEKLRASHSGAEDAEDIISAVAARCSGVHR
jgi:chromate transport protein ChrA